MSLALTAPPHPLLDDADEDLQDLAPRLTSDDATVRRLALIELAELEDPAHVPWLLHALHDTDAAVRAEAAGRLAYWEDEATVAALVRTLEDPEPTVREAAAHSLGELKQPASAEALLLAADHAQPFVRASVLRALRELRLPAAFDPALRALADAEAGVRLEAVGVLGWLKREEALPGLATLAGTDPDADVRRAAVGALGFAPAGGVAVLPALLTATRDAAWQVREEAATTLGKLRLGGAFQPLLDLLDDDWWQVRLRAARALGQLGPAHNVPAVPALSRLLTESIANLRKEAVIALGETRHESALPAVRLAAEDPDPEVRKVARLALTQLQASQ
ncbi:MAG: HEAT repeat domain-containing protein [Pseudomonadota bacterium]